MIPLSDQSWQHQSWQESLSSSLLKVEDLLAYLELDLPPSQWLEKPDFPLFVPRPYLSRIEKGNAKDPLLLQVLPLTSELHDSQEFSKDPLNESSFTPRKGLLHKYRGRVLIIASGTCAINCRYCFRRHFPYQEQQPDRNAWEAIFDYIARQPSISEVILSGGDPLTLNDTRLSWIASELAKIPHISRLRVHSRLPIVIPQRISPSLLDWIEATPLQIVMVIHCNHPNELDEQVALYLQKLRHAGVSLLNQSVLLAGINDSAEVIISLSEKLFEMDVLPYYLHMLDKVSGASHFEVSSNAARKIYQQVIAGLPGYLVPKLVMDRPGTGSKTLILP
ncbi:MAG: EF-P beta-lysylation protein EpmB [Gammaproteobacteria bacterium]|nr:EF-P beta-lysylation protein EpmB [Gammaproteobacteria bacterium]